MLDPPQVPGSLLREVYCVLGVPVDAVSMGEVLYRISEASVSRTPLLISTLNLNFITLASGNFEFKESLLSSDLCTPDGISVILIARLLGVNLRKRVAGSDLFEELKKSRQLAHPLKVVFFGGHEGVAALAAHLLNAEKTSLQCVQSIFPGFGGVNDFSRDDIISNINASGADILIAALGAKNGQLWLLRNHDRLQVPVRAHLGATLNFQAGTIQRAPPILQNLGLEWMWRIKEEPQLVKRYTRDAILLLWLLMTRVLVLAVYIEWLKLVSRFRPRDFAVSRSENESSVTVVFEGTINGRHTAEAIGHLHAALLTKKRITVDLSQAWMTNSRFLGALMMLRKCAKMQGVSFRLTCTSARMRRLLRLNGAAFLVS